MVSLDLIPVTDTVAPSTVNVYSCYMQVYYKRGVVNLSQSNVVLAFRARLKKKGYFDVSVCRLSDQGINRYRVIAKEPLSGMIIIKDMDFVDMFNWR